MCKAREKLPPISFLFNLILRRDVIFLSESVRIHDETWNLEKT